MIEDIRVAGAATGLLQAFSLGEVLEAADVHVALRFGAKLGEGREEVLLATALAVRAVRHGSVLADLATIADLQIDTSAETVIEPVPLPWPDPESWLAAVRESPLVEHQVLRLEDTSVYLDRYWREEDQVCADLIGRAGRTPPAVDPNILEDGLARVFADHDGYDFAEQRTAARAAAARWSTVLTGGPGTGKTTTVAGLLALISEQHETATGRRPRIALAAPTGKAAARLQDAVRSATAALPESDQERLGTLPASTLHRLLGWRPDSNVRFRHHRGNRLPHDVVVVDETSMVALTMMARLLEAVRPDCRLVLVGDPDQLASVEAGAVLADLVEGFSARPDSPVTALRTTHRFGAHIGALAQAIRDANADAVMAELTAGHDDVVHVDPTDAPAIAALHDDVLQAALRVRTAALEGDAQAAIAELDRHRLLCAHREGPYGVGGLNRLVERLLAEATGDQHYDEWYPGRPALITANDYGLGLYNGDMGVTIRESSGRLRVVVPGADGLASFATTRMSEVQTVFAMTVHKSQGSQADRVTVLLPESDSPLLTRELFYTAVTRARTHLRVVGSEAVIRTAIERNVRRATGLARRLSAPPAG